METIKQIHGVYSSWKRCKESMPDYSERCLFGKWHYVFKWNGHDASLIKIDGRWEIFVSDDENPRQFSTRNRCLDYMYKRWLNIGISFLE